MLHLFLATTAIIACAQAQQAGWGSHPPAPAWAAPANWNTAPAPAPVWGSPYASLPIYQHQPAVAVTQPPPVAPTTPPATVIQTRNPDGSSTHGYQTHDGQTRTESFGPDGSVRGSYSYTDPSGKPITVNYIADRLGFRATGDHIPAGTGHGPAPAPAPVAAVQQTPSYASAHVHPGYPGFPASVPAVQHGTPLGAQPIATYSFNSGLGATGLYAGRK